jgi:hypothetical protein
MCMCGMGMGVQPGYGFMASLHPGQIVSAKAGFGFPRLKKPRELVIFIVSGQSAMTTDGIALNCHDVEGLTLTDKMDYNPDITVVGLLRWLWLKASRWINGQEVAAFKVKAKSIIEHAFWPITATLTGLKKQPVSSYILWITGFILGCLLILARPATYFFKVPNIVFLIIMFMSGLAASENTIWKSWRVEPWFRNKPDKWLANGKYHVSLFTAGLVVAQLLSFVYLLIAYS